MTVIRYTPLRHRMLADIDRRAAAGRGRTMRRYPDDRYLLPGAPDLNERQRYVMHQLDGWGLLATMYSGSDALGHYVVPSTAGTDLLARWDAEHGNPRSED